MTKHNDIVDNTANRIKDVVHAVNLHNVVVNLSGSPGSILIAVASKSVFNDTIGVILPHTMSEACVERMRRLAIKYGIVTTTIDMAAATKLIPDQIGIQADPKNVRAFENLSTALSTSVLEFVADITKSVLMSDDFNIMADVFPISHLSVNEVISALEDVGCGEYL